MIYKMDTVDYTGANVRLMKGIQHLPDWKLIIPLLLLTSYTTCDISTPSLVPDSSDQIMTVVTPIGGTASFTWSYDVQPFYGIEWFFGDERIADTSVKSFSKDDISITQNYTYRFHLQTAGKVGFSLTDVTKNDTGTYKCIVTLESTDTLKNLTAKLQVTGERTTIPTPTLKGYTITIWLGVLIPFVVIALLVVLGFLYWRRKKRKSNKITQDNEASAPMTSCIPISCQYVCLSSDLMEVEPKVI